MATRKPLVLVDGKLQQLPAGDQITGATGGGSLHLPVVKHTGGIVRVSLTASAPYSLAVIKADGAAVFVPVGVA